MSNPTSQPRVNVNENPNKATQPNGPVPDANVFTYLRGLRIPKDEEEDQLQMALDPPRTPEYLLEFVRSKGMEERASFNIPLEYLSDTLKAPIRKKITPRLATAAEGGIQFRKRSSEALRVVQAGYNALPGGRLFGSAPAVAAKSATTILVSGGAAHTLGRIEKYYPGLGSGARLVLPTGSEVRAAIRACGLDVLSDAARAERPYEMLALDGEEPGDRVKVNPKASNGYPNMGKWSNENDRTMVLQMAAELRLAILRAYRNDTNAGVWKWVDDMMTTRPYLVAVQGKCKADYYDIGKMLHRSLRFYNVLPRQLTVLMQQATQVLEKNYVNVLDDPMRRTAQGVGLVRGGADHLTAALEEHLDSQHAERRISWVHVGDDSWVVVTFVRDGVEHSAMFALDCSAFDLTQHGDVTLPVHKAIREELSAVVDAAPWAQLWYKYMRERLTVLSGAATVVMRHGGPSGAPLQSKVNDVLMEILIARAAKQILQLDVVDEAGVAAVLARQGERLHFTVRLEQYSEVVQHEDELFPVRAHLEQVPFLFIGYYLHVVELEGVRRVLPFCDLPRTLAQMRYPNAKWVASATSLRLTEAARLIATVANMGIPPAHLAPAYEAMRAEALELSRQASRDATAAELNTSMSQLGFLAGDPVFAGADAVLSQFCLAGLHRYLEERRNEAVWGYALPSVTGSRVGLADEELVAEAAAFAAPLVGGGEASPDTVDLLPLPVSVGAPAVVAPLPKAERKLLLIKRPNGNEVRVEVSAPRAGVRPVTKKNFGRPPPTSSVTQEENLRHKQLLWAQQNGSRRATGAGHGQAEAIEENSDYALSKGRNRRRRQGGRK